MGNNKTSMWTRHAPILKLLLGALLLGLVLAVIAIAIGIRTELGAPHDSATHARLLQAEGAILIHVMRDA